MTSLIETRAGPVVVPAAGAEALDVADDQKRRELGSLACLRQPRNA
jgi:hypothetical protein